MMGNIHKGSAEAAEEYGLGYNLVAGAKFYPSIEGWSDVKFGVIDAQQRILLGEDAKTVLDELQEEIVG